jgi:hypothetical protein
VPQYLFTAEIAESAEKRSVRAQANMYAQITGKMPALQIKT